MTADEEMTPGGAVDVKLNVRWCFLTRSQSHLFMEQRE